jgi:hypothetical protein
MDKNIKWLLMIVLVIGVAAILAAPYAYGQLTFSGRGCRGNDICDTQSDCDLAGNCNTQYSNCVPCGTNERTCPAGVAYCQKTCSQSGNAAQCDECQPDCTNMQIQLTDPFAIVKFTVFTKKNFILDITPKSQAALAGKPVNYKVTLENKHPKTIALKVGVNTPTGWSSKITQDLSLSANSKRDVTFTVTSNESSSDGTYAISFIAYAQELNIFDKIDANYVVASRGPPTVDVQPKTQDGVPGQKLTYTVTVTNTDPADFDASTISLTANVPEGWISAFDKASIKLKPGESGTAYMYVTSAENSAETSYSFSVNATANKLSALGFGEYKINMCGDGVCQPDENCATDCLPEPDFICDGRCEKEVDDGVQFSSVVNFVFNKFIICPRNSTIDKCEAAYDKKACGYGKQCLCGSGMESQCSMLCVDKKGVYYLYAKGDMTARSASNYSFACPYVNLPEIIQIRGNFTNAKTNYEKARSAYKETMDKNMSERARLMPCYNVLDLIVRNITAHVSYLDAVIAWPGKINTTIARARTEDLRALIESLYNRYCRGAAGVLTIDSITPPATTERYADAKARVVVKNTGSTNYYGYLECDFVPPSGEKISVKQACTQMNTGFSGIFNPTANVSIDGDWKIKCRVYGSLDASCDGVVHDEKEGTFNVYSRDAYVVDVSGRCEGNTLICSVRLNKNVSCAGCKVGNNGCTFLSREGPVSNFSCHVSGFGSYNITGYVTPTENCVPVTPTFKNVTARCAGCGDNVVESPEQCELPDTNNNNKCTQTQILCDGKKYGARDKYGFCNPSCQCAPDEYTFSCTRGKCGAVCSDGETKNKTYTTPQGRCICAQQCDDDCQWEECNCEPNNATGAGVEILDISVSNNCPIEKGSIDVTCASSVPRVDCIKAKIGSTICEMNNNSYWYGNSLVFAGCAVGTKTNSVCGNNSREVKCYVDRTKCIQSGSDKVTWIDVMPANESTTPTTKCTVKIDSKNCSFSSQANRYEVTVRASWVGGDHAHAAVDDDESKIMRAPTFSFTSQAGTPGLKVVKAYVHDTKNKVLCYDSSEIYCGTGLTSGNLFDVVREMKDKTKPGNVTVKLIIIPYKTLSNLTVTEHVRREILVMNRNVSGNTSVVLMSGPSTTLEGTYNYSVYSWKLDLEKGKNVTISYTARVDMEGKYKFYSKSKYSTEEKTEEKILSVWNCDSLNPVWANNTLTGACQQFDTPCHVSQPWIIKPNGCQEIPITPEEKGFDWTIPIIIIVVIIIVVLYMKREWVKEKWEELKEKIEEWRYGREQT